MPLKTVSEIAALIAEGRHLLVAGDEALLAQLPAGSWIGDQVAGFAVSAPFGNVQTALAVLGKADACMT